MSDNLALTHYLLFRKIKQRKLVTTDDKCTTEPKQIMTEIHNFYANLYDKDSANIPNDEFLKGISSKMLTDEQRERPDTKITITEYFGALKSFEKNETPSNDRLTIEFYLAIWDLKKSVAV